MKPGTGGTSPSSSVHVGGTKRKTDVSEVTVGEGSRVPLDHRCKEVVPSSEELVKG